jgi:hypothetical protein
MLFLDGQGVVDGESLGFLKDDDGGAAITGAERRVKIIAMPVYWAAVLVGGEGDFNLVFRSVLPMPVLAVVARDAGQGE